MPTTMSHKTQELNLTVLLSWNLFYHNVMYITYYAQLVYLIVVVHSRTHAHFFCHLSLYIANLWDAW